VTQRYLWLLRHAKTVTDPPPGGSDFDRVLAPRGRRDANELRQLFAGKGEGLGTKAPLPTVALVSPAARTAATADLVLADMAKPPEVVADEDLYGAGPDDVLGMLRKLPDEVVSVMVVGHNPTAHALSHGLISPSDKKGLDLATKLGFPTCALAVERFALGHWSDVEAHSAKLVTLLIPPFNGA
jgi:phosphohistidine phosphatase